MTTKPKGIACYIFILFVITIKTTRSGFIVKFISNYMLKRNMCKSSTNINIYLYIYITIINYLYSSRKFETETKKIKSSFEDQTLELESLKKK